MDNPIEESLSILPHEKLIEILLALDNLEDIFNACRSSTIFARVCQDDYFWKLRYQQDFGLDSPPMRMTWRDYYQLTIENNRSLPFSVGYGYLGVIDKKSQLSMWGENRTAQLGNGTIVSTGVPQIVLSNVRQVSCGAYETGAITKDGKVYTWGGNPRGSLGLGSRQDTIILVPTLVELPEKVRKIDIGHSGSIVLTEDGKVYIWGDLTHYLYTDTPLKLNLPSKEKIIDVAAGNFIFAAITKSGKLYMWGDNNFYLYLSKNWRKQQRRFKIYNLDDPEHTKFTQPTLIPFPEHARQISMGENHFGVVTRKGKLWMVGGNYLHQIGEYISNKEELDAYQKLLVKVNTSFLKDVIVRFVLIKLPSRVLYFNTRWDTSLVKLKDGRILMWGNNDTGQIDHGVEASEIYQTGEVITKPVEISIDRQIVHIAAGATFTVAITDDGYVNLWGLGLPLG